LVQYTPGFIPFIYVARYAPFIKSIEYPVNEILLLARLAKHCPALIVESGDDLLKSVNGVMLYVDLEGLWDSK